MVSTTEEAYRGWTVRLEYRAGYGYSWVAWKAPQQRLESYGGYLESRAQSRHNAHWVIDRYEAGQPPAHLA